MIKKIWKFELSIDDGCFVTMPVGAEILSIQLQNNKPVLWALVDPSVEEKEVRHFEMFGTGHDIPYSYTNKPDVDRKFLATLQPIECGLGFAFHIFERIS